MTVDIKQARRPLQSWFSARLPSVQHLEVSELTTPGAGVSNETYFVTITYRFNGKIVSEDLVIRWPPDGFLVFPKASYDMTHQFNILKCLELSQIPSPGVFGLEEDPTIIGKPFFVMHKVPGWIPSDFPPYHQAGPLFEMSLEEQERIWWAGLETVVAIHELDLKSSGLSLLGVPTGTGFIDAQIKLYDAVLAQNSDPVPDMLVKTRQWLLNNRFEPHVQSLCWGDARLGNMIFEGSNVIAALDWEMAVIGDPIADLAWYLHVDWASSEGRPTAPTPRLSGLPGKNETIAKYEVLTGQTVSNFDYYDVLAAYRLAVIYTRIEQDQTYLNRSGNSKGMLTTTHFEKLNGLMR